MPTKKLVDLAKTIRSKNAGTDRITFDIIFREKENYEMVKSSKAISIKSMAKLFNIKEKEFVTLLNLIPLWP